MVVAVFFYSRSSCSIRLSKSATGSILVAVAWPFDELAEPTRWL